VILLWIPAKAHNAALRTTLAEADRLALLYNWPRALPLYLEAEREFRRLNDPKGELDARLGWIRAPANATPSSGGGTVVRIAPGFDSSEWQALTPDDPGRPDWTKASAVLKRRIYRHEQPKYNPVCGNSKIERSVGMA
jgi:hypothetical protein